jgi:hypothetical protein
VKIVIFAKALAAFTVLAMIALFISPAMHAGEFLVEVAKFEGLAVAAAIITAFAYPYIRGIDAGDKVLIFSNDPVNGRMGVHIATALESGKLHAKIRVSLGNGSDAVCEIVSLPGIITPAGGKLTPESMVKVI